MLGAKKHVILQVSVIQELFKAIYILWNIHVEVEGNTFGSQKQNQ